MQCGKENTETKGPEPNNEGISHNCIDFFNLLASTWDREYMDINQRQDISSVTAWDRFNFVDILNHCDKSFSLWILQDGYEKCL